MEVVRVRLDLAYDGGPFAGWAAQPGLRTVQGELESALAQVLRVPARLTVAGRTDSGVHALHQVAHFDLPAEAWAALPGRSARAPGLALVERLRGVLPAAVVVRKATLAPPGFDARFSAGSRRYIYRIDDDGAATNPLAAGYVLRHRGLLDVDAMDAASRALVGLRDFAAYCRARPDATTIRRLLTFAWRRVPSGADAGLVQATIRADAFCHHMVRALVGAVVKVGAGRAAVDWPLEVLRSRDRSQAAALVPAHGLTLAAISYPPPPFDARRALRIRAKRTTFGAET